MFFSKWITKKTEVTKKKPNDKKLVKSEKDIIFTSNNNDTLYGTGFWSNFDMTKSQIVKPKGIINQEK